MTSFKFERKCVVLIRVRLQFKMVGKYDLCCFQFQVLAVDDRPQGVQRSSQASVTINVLRDLSPPQFVNTPYRDSVPINTPVNTTVFNVRAIDNDLKVSNCTRHQQNRGGYSGFTVCLSLCSSVQVFGFFALNGKVFGMDQETLHKSCPWPVEMP